MHRAIFLDRDGVINAMVYHQEYGLIDSPANPKEFVLLPGAARAINRINAMGFLAIVISNQPGVAKGKFTVKLLEEMKEKMLSDLASEEAQLDAVYYCLHHPEAVLDVYRENCDCRKPKPGLLARAASEWNINLAASYFLGDGITDIVAGRLAGCKTFLLNSRKCYLCDELARHNIAPDYIGKNLADAIDAIERLENNDAEAEQAYGFRCRLNVN